MAPKRLLRHVPEQSTVVSSTELHQLRNFANGMGVYSMERWQVHVYPETTPGCIAAFITASKTLEAALEPGTQAWRKR